MAQLYFRYATMGSGKTVDLLKIAYNYTEARRREEVFPIDCKKAFEMGARIAQQSSL